MRTKAKSAINGLKKSLLDMKTFINEVSNILIVWINWDLLNTNKFRHFIKCSSSIRTCKSKICSINNLDIVIKMYIFDILVYSIILASVVFLWKKDTHIMLFHSPFSANNILHFQIWCIVITTNTINGHIIVILQFKRHTKNDFITAFAFLV
jgi:hypothetical protein